MPLRRQGPAAALLLVGTLLIAGGRGLVPPAGGGADGHAQSATPAAAATAPLPLDRLAATAAAALAGDAATPVRGDRVPSDEAAGPVFAALRDGGAHVGSAWARNDNQNFYPGEALLLWATLYRENPGPALLDRCMASFRSYRAWHPDEANRNPAFVPWHTQADYLV